MGGAILEKEADIMNLQNKSALQQADLSQLREHLELAETKMRALEAFSSDLQNKYDKVEARCRDKES